MIKQYYIKTCIKCELDKPYDEFNCKKDSKDGYRNICRICQKEVNKAYRLNNKERSSDYHKNYFLENEEKLKKYVNDNRIVINKNKAKYRKNNPEKIKNTQKLWCKNNPHIIAFRNVLKNSLIRLGKPKEGHTIDLLGYSALDLHNHLTALFTDGMNWDNYGEWHIDHIKPVSKFNPEMPPSIVNALSNLRPLWATTREINGVIYEGNLNKNKY